jgi:predicted transcriptional regulator
MSVKPKYVMEILAGRKKYEYRKSIFKRKVNKIYLYSTSPQKKIVGYFFYEYFIQDNPMNIWKITRDVSGITEKEYFDYFYNKEIGFAIKINQFYPFIPSLDPLVQIKGFYAPQSYIYIEKEIM